VSNRKNNTFLVLYFLYSIVQKTRSLFHTKCKYWYIPVSKIAKKNNLKECVFVNSLLILHSNYSVILSILAILPTGICIQGVPHTIITNN